MNPFYKTLEVIWENPRFVFVNKRQLKEVAKEIAREDLKIPNWRMPVYYPEDDESFVQFIGIQNSINFAFRDFKTKRAFKIEYKDKEWPGSAGMIGSLLRAIEEGIPVLDTEYLTGVSLSDMAHIFRSVPDYCIPMLKERTEIFREVGRVLLEKYDGSFWNLFRDAGFMAFGPYGIVNQLRRNFPSFNDVSFHKESQTWLHFHKRSQLLVMIYQGRALDSKGKLPLIQDIDDLGAIADYSVPRNLEYLGILRYDSRLRDRIFTQQIIEPHSLEEQEIRAMTALAIKKIIEATGYNICSIDYKFWDLGRKERITTPHHLTPTILY